MIRDCKHMIESQHIHMEQIKIHNKNWPYIPDRPYRILIIGGSGSGKQIYY